MTTKKPLGFTTIEGIVANVLDEMGKQHMYNELAETIAQKVIRGYRELNMFHRLCLQVVYLPVSEMGTVDLPDDYVDYHKIGLVYNGRVWTLSINETIALPRREECGVPVRDVITNANPQNFDYGYSFPDHYRNGRFVGGLYGLGGGFNKAYYRIDDQRNQIVLSGSIHRCEIVLEYQSNGISTSRNTLIPRECTEALTAFCMWKMLIANMEIPMNRIEMYKQNYYEAVESLRFLETAMTVDEYKDALYEGFFNAPKR